MRNEPILRNAGKAGGVTEQSLTASSFNKIFKNIVENAGYYCRITVHSLRRGFGNAVDSKTVPLPFALKT